MPKPVGWADRVQHGGMPDARTEPQPVNQPDAVAIVDADAVTLPQPNPRTVIQVPHRRA